METKEKKQEKIYEVFNRATREWMEVGREYYNETSSFDRRVIYKRGKK